MFYKNYTQKYTVSSITWNDPFQRFAIGAFDGTSNIDDTMYDWARIRLVLPDPGNPDPTVSIGVEHTI